MVILSLLLSFSVHAAGKCSSEDLIQKSCDFYELNADKPWISSAPDQKFPNPLFKLESSAIGYQGSASQKELAEATLEFEMVSANVLANSKLKTWPERTLKSISSRSNVLSLIKLVNPSDERLKDFGFALVPFPFEKSDSEYVHLTPEQLSTITSKLTVAEIEQLKISSDLYLTKFAANELAELKEKEFLSPPVIKEARISEVTKLFAETKRLTIEFYKNTSKKVTEEQTNLIRRLELVQLEIPKNDAVEQDCRGKIPSAQYQTTRHRIQLCRKFLTYPDAWLVAMLAHELNHAVDQCASTYPLFKVNEKLNDIAEQWGKNFETIEKYKKLRIEITEPVRYVTQAFPDGYSMLPEVEKLGGLQKVTDAIRVDKHPLEEVRACLASKEKLDEVTDQDINEFVSKMPKKEMLESKIKYSRDRYCFGLPNKKSKTREFMSDVVGAAVLSKYFKSNPPQNFTQLMSAFSFITSQACDPHTNEVIKKMSTSDHLLRVHPLPRQRLGSIYFKMTGIAEHFGCELKPQSKCLDDLEAK